MRFYQDVIGFRQLLHFDDNQSHRVLRLMSTVVDGTRIFMPLNEPADGRKKSQIQVPGPTTAPESAHRAAHH